jgi:hypothetical protein
MLTLNALLCMSQEYFLPPAMHGNDDIMFIEIYFTDYVFSKKKWSKSNDPKTFQQQPLFN